MSDPLLLSVHYLFYRYHYYHRAAWRSAFGTSSSGTTRVTLCVKKAQGHVGVRCECRSFSAVVCYIISLAEAGLAQPSSADVSATFASVQELSANELNQRGVQTLETCVGILAQDVCQTKSCGKIAPSRQRGDAFLKELDSVLRSPRCPRRTVPGACLPQRT